MYKFRRILVADLLNLITNPMWLFYALGFPVILILALGFLTSGSYGGDVTSYDYYGIALMVYNIFNAATFSANSFLEDRIKGPNMRIVYAPVKPFYIHFSKVVASTLFSTAAYTIVAVFLSLAVGVNYGGSDAWLLFIILLLANFFMSALGVLVCCILKSENETNQILSLILTLAAALGGIFFPVDGFGSAIATASWISPAKWMMVAALRIVYDYDYAMFFPISAGLIILSAVSVLLSCRIFRGEDYI